MTEFFFKLTRRNWGVAWHYIIASLAVSILLMLGIPVQWVFPAVFITGLINEFYQLKQGEDIRAFAEDMVANILGILSGWLL